MWSLTTHDLFGTIEVGRQWTITCGNGSMTPIMIMLVNVNVWMNMMSNTLVWRGCGWRLKRRGCTVGLVCFGRDRVIIGIRKYNKLFIQLSYSTKRRKLLSYVFLHIFSCQPNRGNNLLGLCFAQGRESFLISLPHSIPNNEPNTVLLFLVHWLSIWEMKLWCFVISPKVDG